MSDVRKYLGMTISLGCVVVLAWLLACHAVGGLGYFYSCINTVIPEVGKAFRVIGHLTPAISVIYLVLLLVQGIFADWCIRDSLGLLFGVLTFLVVILILFYIAVKLGDTVGFYLSLVLLLLSLVLDWFM